MPGLDQLNSTYSRTNSCLILNEVEVVPFSSHFPHLCCSVTQSCLTLCDLIDCRTPGFPVLHHLRSLLKLMSIESVMPSHHLIFCRPLLLLLQAFPASVFPINLSSKREEMGGISRCPVGGFRCCFCWCVDGFCILGGSAREGQTL